jgi:hypothetical protein
MNSQSATVVLAENAIAVLLDEPKLAIPVGTVPGLQLAAVLKLPEPGLASQVAFWAEAGSVAAAMATPARYVRIAVLRPISSGPPLCAHQPINRIPPRSGPPPLVTALKLRHLTLPEVVFMFFINWTPALVQMPVQNGNKSMRCDAPSQT